MQKFEKQEQTKPPYHQMQKKSAEINKPEQT